MIKLYRYKTPFRRLDGTTYIDYEPQLALLRKVNKADETIFGFKKNFAYVCARVWVGGKILKDEIYYLTKKELENGYVLLDKETV